jgi:tetratricopeptide (TPR) repeat protein
MRTRVLLFLVVLLVQSSFADEAALQLEQANQLYRGGDFQNAAVMYEQIAKNGYEGASLYYNLGNAYFKLHNIPAAILNYERAKRLAPRDEDISYNLRLCNLRVVDKIEAIPSLFFVEWWHNLLNLMSSENWGILGIAMLWCTVIGGAVFMISRSLLLRRSMFPLAVVCLIAALFSFVGMVQRSHIEQSDQQAIVFSQTVPVKSAPDVQSTDLFVLHEGVKVDVMDNVSSWRKIRLADGKIGWIPTDALQTI